jgi:hypothetical protein
VRFVLRDEDSADAVVRTLGPPLQMVPNDDEEVTGIRPISTPPGPREDDISGEYAKAARRPTMPIETRPFLFVGSSDDRLASLSSELGRPVARVLDAVGLLEAIEFAAGVPVVLVVDCVKPTVQPTTVATIAPDLPAGSSIVLWGAAPGLEVDLRRLVGAAMRWVTVDERVDASSVLEAAME